MLKYNLKVAMEYKIFVGGLTVQTTEEDLEEYFSSIGSITQTAVIKNKVTGLSKCYAFVHTNDVRTYQRIISTRHTLNGRIIDCKDGFNRHENPFLFEKLNSRKFFVGGLAPSTQDKHLEEYFQKFGPVFKAYVIMDPNTNRSKRFGFIIMETEESVFRVLEQKVHIINGYSINCKRFDRSMPENGAQSDGLSGPPGLSQLKEDFSIDNGQSHWSEHPSGCFEDWAEKPQGNPNLLNLTPASKPFVPEQPAFPQNVFAQADPETDIQDGAPDEDYEESKLSEKISMMCAHLPPDAKSLHLRYLGYIRSGSSAYNIDNYSQSSASEEIKSSTRYNFCAQKTFYEKCNENFLKMNKPKPPGDPSHEGADSIPSDLGLNPGMAHPGF